MYFTDVLKSYTSDTKDILHTFHFYWRHVFLLNTFHRKQVYAFFIFTARTYFTAVKVHISKT